MISSFQENQGIIVADLGGGTANLVSYKIVALNPLQVEEMCIGVGKTPIMNVQMSQC